MDYEEYDLSGLMDNQTAQNKEQKENTGLRKIKGEFISAMPFHWIQVALQIKGSAALKAALCCHHFATLKKSNGDWFAITNNQASKFSLTPESKNSGLIGLEKAGLIELKERTGKSRLIKIIMPESNNEPKQKSSVLER